MVLVLKQSADVRFPEVGRDSLALGEIGRAAELESRGKSVGEREVRDRIVAYELPVKNLERCDHAKRSQSVSGHALEGVRG